MSDAAEKCTAEFQQLNDGRWLCEIDEYGICTVAETLEQAFLAALEQLPDEEE